jgi:hypothetical protein
MAATTVKKKPSLQLQPKKLRLINIVQPSSPVVSTSALYSRSNKMAIKQPQQQQQQQHPRSQYYTRSRLLHQLGITPQQQPHRGSPPSSSVVIQCLASSSDNGSSTSSSGSASSNSMLAGAVPFEMKLNDMEEDFHSQNQSLFAPQHSLSSSSSSTTSSSPSPSCSSSFSSASPTTPATIPHNGIHNCNHSINRKRIHFHETVRVVPIPSRYQYSDRIKQTIWSNRHELQEMAQRNLLEFESEGYDWKNVVLDEDMYLDASTVSGNQRQVLIHPCHVHGDSYVHHHGVNSTSNEETKQVEEQEEEEEDDADAHFAPLQKLESFVTRQ